MRFLTKVCETIRKLCNYSEKLQRSCGCAIITIRACRQLFRLSLKKSIALGISSSSHISYMYEHKKKRDAMCESLHDVYATNVRFYLHFQDYGNADLQVCLTISRDHGPDCRSLDPCFQWKRWVTFNKSALYVYGDRWP